MYNKYIVQKNYVIRWYKNVEKMRNVPLILLCACLYRLIG
jgi:hypothetical protein